MRPWSVWCVGSFDCQLWCLSSWHQCKGTGGYVVHNVGCYTSGSPSSSGTGNTKVIASVSALTLLTSVIKWSLVTDVVSCLLSISWLLECLVFYSATKLSCGLFSCNLLVHLVELCKLLIWAWLLCSILGWHHHGVEMTSSLRLIIG